MILLCARVYFLFGSLHDLCEREIWLLSSIPTINVMITQSSTKYFWLWEHFKKKKKKTDRVYLLADKDCDAGKCEWWPLPPGRPRVCCVTDESDASCFDTSWPFEVDDDVDEGVNDDVKYCEAQSFCKNCNFLV